MTNIKFGEKALTIILACCIFVIYGTVAKAESIRIAIFPFSIHSAEELDYMQAGVYEMLANRLTSSDGAILVIPRTELAKQLAAGYAGSLKEKTTISRSLQADYFVSGSLTALGNSISTDVQFYRTDQKNPLVKLSQTGAQGDVIRHIDQFASTINQKVFEKSVVATEPSDIGKADAPADAPIDGLSIVAKEGGDKGRWQSNIFKTRFKGVALGDINGDGTLEIIMVDKYRIYVTQFSDNRLKDVSQVELGQYANVLAIDVADINKNGKPEIFITNFANLTERPTSLIYEYADKGLSILTKDTKWFYRVQRAMDDQITLTAQSKLINLSAADKIQVLRFKEGQYVVTASINPPKKLNIFDTTFFQHDKSDARMFVGYDRNNEITAWSNDGDVLWESGEPAGGSLNYVEYSDRQSMDKVRHYISKRILLADTDRNGKNEVIFIKNINSSPEWMARARRYKRGYVICLEWDASGALETKWKTEEERGYISDMAIGDATNDGKVDLVFTVVSDVKMKSEKSSSYLVIQQLP